MASVIANSWLLRQLRIIAASVCVMLALALMAMWVRSYSFWDSLRGPPVDVVSWRGQIGAMILPGPKDPQWTAESLTTERIHQMKGGNGSWPPDPQLLGFYFNFIKTGGYRITFPHGLPILIAGAFAILLKPKPRFRFNLREVFTLVTVAAIVLGSVMALASGISQ